MNDLLKNTSPYGYGFVEGDEYAIRNSQMKELLGLSPSDFRALKADEIALLEANGNRCLNTPAWNDILVAEPFRPSLIRNSLFAGQVLIGPLEEGFIRCHDYTVPIGISNSRIISCVIAGNAAIHDCQYLSHYIIEENVLLSCINEMDTTNHAKFGEGIIKEGESEDVRVWIEPLNETGGRAVLPFREMITADAYLWTMYREDSELMEAFKRISSRKAAGVAHNSAQRGYYGVVERGAAIKHCLTIKDVWVGEGAYIKGANKLKNITVKSSADEATQIGEGVELVNGIVGYGSHVFYGSKAVRFVLGNNCNLKYGARLIHSILGDNSTVSCCEILNNLVFPFHEQHHNNSFLIATMIMGQSNMAAGATVGSNHNSRGNDGEIIAGRGFWPGLSSTLKHNCRFASFVLISKGNYPVEMNIPLPFSLLSTSVEGGGMRRLMPGYWWLHNMYALERNQWKFTNRDKRIHKTQHIVTEYLAPDTVEEIIKAIELLHKWKEEAIKIDEDGSFYIEGLERSRQPIKIVKPGRGVRAYREMLTYYAVRALREYLTTNDTNDLPTANHTNLLFKDFADFQQKYPGPVSFEWVNIGGQLIPQAKLEAILNGVKDGSLSSWDMVHAQYDKAWEEYPLDKALNALQVLRYLEGGLSFDDRVTLISEEKWQGYCAEAERLDHYVKEQIVRTKRKDYKDPFRKITYRNEAEMLAVLGRMEDNSFIKSVIKPFIQHPTLP